MKKHAYLIMAHTDWSLFSKLLQTLDDPRNDLYIHIDAKADFPADDVYKPKFADCTYIQRKNISWGGDSIVKCELALLRSAHKVGYDYYHLLSGVDLPLKTQDEIHRFFDENNGKNYLMIDHNAMSLGVPGKRVKYYHFLQNRIGRNEGPSIAMLRIAERLSLSLQKKLHLDRLRHCPWVIYKGAQWFSITHEMVSEILSSVSFIKKYCYHSFAPDEIFLQTVAMNSKLRDTIVLNYLRYIDWQRGSPYTFTSEDYDILMESNCFFARKFSDQVDSSITARIVNEVTANVP